MRHFPLVRIIRTVLLTHSDGSWSHAFAECRSWSSKLVRIESPRLNARLVKLTTDYQRKRSIPLVNWWIGLSDLFGDGDDGDFRWIDNDGETESLEIAAARWAPSEPNNGGLFGGSDEDCVVLTITTMSDANLQHQFHSRWSDTPCDFAIAGESGYICEKYRSKLHGVVVGDMFIKTTSDAGVGADSAKTFLDAVTDNGTALLPVPKYWPGGVIPIIIESEFASAESKRIENSLQAIMRTTCGLKFVKRNSSFTDFVRITRAIK